MAAKKFLTDGIPPEYETSMTYASWRSPFCPNPAQFHAATINRFNEGCLFWVYIGHGYPYQLDRVRVPGATHHILNTADMVRLDNQRGMPIAIFLACYTGAYDQLYDCLAEQMVRAPGGPVAAFAGSRVTMPYAMAVLGNGLMDGYFHQQLETLGEVVLYAKRQMIDEDPQGTDRKLLDLLAKALSPDPQLLHSERLEHLPLFNLFGDPLLKLKYPQAVRAGGRRQGHGRDPLGGPRKPAGAGRCHVLVCRRDRMRADPPPRQRFDRSPQRRWRSTPPTGGQRPLLAQREVTVEPGNFLTAVKIPPEARGACHVCVFLENGDGHAFALGSTDIYIATPKLASLPVQASLEDDSSHDERPANDATLRRSQNPAATARKAPNAWPSCRGHGVGRTRHAAPLTRKTFTAADCGARPAGTARTAGTGWWPGREATIRESASPP